MKLTVFRLLLILIISMLIFSISYAQNLNSFTLTGNWESVGTESNHVQILRFEADSTFYFQSDLSAEYSYSIVGNKMITKLLNSVKKIIDTSEIVFKKDTLISTLRKNGNNEVTTMIKIHDDYYDSAGIVGNYLWKYPNAHIAFSKFTKDGIWFFRLPVDLNKGKYITSNDSLTILCNGIPAEKMKYWITDKVLILTDKTGKDNFYKKVDYFVKE